MFPERLKLLRSEKKLSQQDMADFLSVDRTAYGKYENGANYPNMDKLEALADFFGVTLDFLLGRTELRTYDLPDDLITVALHRANGELNEEGKEELIKYIDYLRERYKKE